MVFDIDETTLSNWEIIRRDDFGRPIGGPCDLSTDAPCGWAAWDQLGRSQAIPTTLDLYRSAIAQNVTVFFITGRPERQRGATTRNLGEAGYSRYETLYMVPDGAHFESAADFKAPIRSKILAPARSAGLHAVCALSRITGSSHLALPLASRRPARPRLPTGGRRPFVAARPRRPQWSSSIFVGHHLSVRGERDIVPHPCATSESPKGGRFFCVFPAESRRKVKGHQPRYQRAKMFHAPSPIAMFVGPSASSPSCTSSGLEFGPAAHHVSSRTERP